MLRALQRYIVNWTPEREECCHHTKRKVVPNFQNCFVLRLCVYFRYPGVRLLFGPVPSPAVLRGGGSMCFVHETSRPDSPFVHLPCVVFSPVWLAPTPSPSRFYSNSPVRFHAPQQHKKNSVEIFIDIFQMAKILSNNFLTCQFESRHPFG